MSTTVFETQFVVAAPLAKVWAFHDDPVNLTKIMTGPVRMQVNAVDRPLVPGSRVQMTLKAGPFNVPWNVTLREKTAPSMFRDEQPPGEGPFKIWRHTHQFEAVSADITKIRDRIEYEPPLGLLGKIGNALIGRIVMNQMFVGRRDATKAFLERG